MSFSEALVQLKKGKKIAREHWGGYWYIDYVEALAHGNERQMIIAKLATGDYDFAPAQAYQSDLLANDWKIIE